MPVFAVYSVCRSIYPEDIGMNRIIGSYVHVVIDRPLGSAHPEHPGLIYGVNYGYIPGVIAPDGEEQDAYVLGPDRPLNEFSGIITAILVRDDDTETKWIVEQENAARLSDREILSAVHFQERFFRTRLLRYDPN